MTRNKINILFLCVANSARSQMAEGLAKSIFGDLAEVQSMGSKPCGYLHPWALEAMQEVGVDIRDQYSKSLQEIPESFLGQLDYAIILCDQEACPITVSAKHHLSWPFSDPACDPEESKPEVFRRIRDKIETRIRGLANELNSNQPAASAKMSLS